LATILSREKISKNSESSDVPKNSDKSLTKFRSDQIFSHKVSPMSRHNQAIFLLKYTYMNVIGPNRFEF
jgi:hypothetical protein